MSKIEKFEGIKVWQKARGLVKKETDSRLLTHDSRRGR